MLKKTPLASAHKKLGAQMVNFGGWLMPVSYTNVIDEHLVTRRKAGLFDICHMGEIKITGTKSQDKNDNNNSDRKGYRLKFVI